MLILPIKKQWFDMILTSEKKEEYREIKPYYESRFMNAFGGSIFCGSENLHMEQVMFRNGYSKKSPSFIADCSLHVGEGNPEWGAEINKDYFVLEIHKIVWKSSDNMGGYINI